MEDSERYDGIDQISVRACQVIAAICVDRFCREHGASHPAITAFIQHLWGFATVSNEFVAWEKSLTRLELHGLGDPIPPGVLSSIPKVIRSDFAELIEAASEVVMCDAYGAVTDEPHRYLRSAFAVLRRNGISPPDLSEFYVSSFSQNHGLGDPVPTDVLSRWRLV
jgi:hypothetical protein